MYLTDSKFLDSPNTVVPNIERTCVVEGKKYANTWQEYIDYKTEAVETGKLVACIPLET